VSPPPTRRVSAAAGGESSGMGGPYGWEDVILVACAGDRRLACGSQIETGPTCQCVGG
jgi:hypothetical protein